MKALRGHCVLAVLGAFCVSAAGAQELKPRGAIFLLDTNSVSATALITNQGWQIGYDAKPLARSLRRMDLRFNEFHHEELHSNIKGMSRMTGIEAAERANLRLMQDYRSRAERAAASREQPQLRPSEVERLLERR